MSRLILLNPYCERCPSTFGLVIGPRNRELALSARRERTLHLVPRLGRPQGTCGALFFLVIPDRVRSGFILDNSTFLCILHWRFRPARVSRPVASALNALLRT